MTTMLALFNNVSTSNGVYGLALKAASKFLSPDLATRISEETKLIEHTENEATIEVLRSNGELSANTELMCKELDALYINTDMMTPEETERIHQFATNATPDIVEKKIETIMGEISRIRQGVHTLRDWGFDSDKADAFANIMEKGIRYERGEIDTTTYPFDASLYPKDSDRSQMEIDNLFLTLTPEELVDEGIVDPQDFFVYGPYTAADLECLTGFATDTWVRASDGRSSSRLTNFFDNAVGKLGFQIDDDLNRDFVTREIIPHRRLSAKNIVSIVGAFGQECNEIVFSNSKQYAKDGNYDQLRKSLQLCTHYIVLICRFDKEEIASKWKVARPIAADFYAEAIAKAGKWDETGERNIEADYGGYLIKLDDHLFEAQAAYMNLLSAASKPKAKKEHALLE